MRTRLLALSALAVMSLATALPAAAHRMNPVRPECLEPVRCAARSFAGLPRGVFPVALVW